MELQDEAEVTRPSSRFARNRLEVKPLGMCVISGDAPVAYQSESMLAEDGLAVDALWAYALS